MSARFFLVDGPGYLYRAYHALPYLSTSQGPAEPRGASACPPCSGSSSARSTPDYFGVAWDPPGPTFRDEKFAAYKETRPAMPDDLREPDPATSSGSSRRCACRSSRCRASRPTTCSARWCDRMRDRADRAGPGHRRQGHAPARRPARARALDDRARRRARLLRRGRGEGQVGRRARADPRPPRADGRLDRQHPRRARAWARRRRSSSSASSAASSASTRTSRWCRASSARRWPPTASRRSSRASWRR